MGKKNKKDKKKKGENLEVDTCCVGEESPDIEVEVTLDEDIRYTEMDMEVYAIVSQMKTQMGLTREEKNLRVFLSEVIAIGARAVRLAQALDEFKETIQLASAKQMVHTVKDGMNRLRGFAVESDVTTEQEEADLPRSKGRHDS